MRVSYAWLQEYLDLDRSPEELAETLTMGGIEVGAIDDWRGRYDNIVAARITAIEPHPNADRLQLATVESGGRSHRIVCGAANIAVGQAVPLALLGATLPNGLTIEARQIRGVPSEGMLCSSIELNLGHDAEGILILPEESKVGASLAEILQLHDAILELDLTPNRPDCLSMLGVVREVAALCNLTPRPPRVDVRDSGPEISGRVRIDVERPDLCPRYYARLIEGVHVGPSPLWMQLRLLKLGLRPINNIVDSTNYVLMERGQPLHAFDFDLLAERRIVVRGAEAGERFVTLDGAERILEAEMLMIADGARSIAVAGVMGGQNSEVHEETRAILLESAYFSPAGIRRTSKRLGLHTEASHRFERGVDPNGAGLACDRAAQLMADLAGGGVAHGAIDLYPAPIAEQQARLRVSRVNAVLGVELSADEVRGALDRLRLPVRDDGADEFLVSMPTCRPDLTREIDLIEEVARLHGFDSVPATLPVSPLAAESAPSQRPLEHRLREILFACGLAEAITYSFINEEWLESFHLEAGDARGKPAPLSNPLSAEFSVLRTMLLPGLLNCLRQNAAHQQSDIKLFEYGKIFLPSSETGALPVEERHLAVVLSGARQSLTWTARSAAVDFFDLKGIVEQITNGFRLGDFDLVPRGVPFLHPGRALSMRCNGQEFGVMGEIHPDVLARFESPPGVFALELHVEPFFEAAEPTPTFIELPRYPASVRDLAVLVDETAPSNRVEAVIRAASTAWLRDVTLFDCFRGATIPAGKKSLAYSLTFQADDRTLTDEMVNEQWDAILAALAKEFQAGLRER